MPDRNHGMSNKHHLTQTFLKTIQARWNLNLQSLHILFRISPWSSGVLFFRDQALLLQCFQSHALRSGQLSLRPQIGWEPSMALPVWKTKGNTCVTDWPLGDADDIMLPCVAAWRCQRSKWCHKGSLTFMKVPPSLSELLPKTSLQNTSRMNRLKGLTSRTQLILWPMMSSSI